MSDDVVSFRSATAFRAWLKRHHASASHLVVRLFKTHAADQGLTYGPALDEALCHGWIDGVRRRLDDDSFSIRFTPRKPRSIWSKVNVAHVERLAAAGRMTPAGRAAFAAREARRTGIYSFEQEAVELAPQYRKRFRAQRAAWAWFEAEAPWYRRKVIYWVMSAKQEATRLSRLERLIAASARKTRC